MPTSPTQADQDVIILSHLCRLAPNRLNQFLDAEDPPAEIKHYIADAPMSEVYGTLMELLARVPA